MDSPLPERFDISDGDDAGMEYGDGDQYESLHESYEVQEEINRDNEGHEGQVSNDHAITAGTQNHPDRSAAARMAESQLRSAEVDQRAEDYMNEVSEELRYI